MVVMTSFKPELQVRLLAGLAQLTRLRIVAVVAEAPEPGLPAGDIARAVRCPASTLSFHLKELVQAGVLEVRASGRFMIYQLRRDAFQGLCEFLQVLGGTRPDSRAEPPASGRRKPARSRRAVDSDQLSMFGE
ncbi:MAG: ArsR family transcriptional regulator [Gammaproteobacteria bacterium]|nr:MAG: ArsR family transcriptional regulator [Gammaproteobacteria bacterium]